MSTPQTSKRTDHAILKMAEILSAMQNQVQDTLHNLTTPEDIVTQIQPYYKSELAKDLQLPTVYRYSQGKYRFYFTVHAVDGTEPTGNALQGWYNVLYYPSVTTIIGNTTPMSYGLQKLIGDLGMKGYYQFMREKARYGTFLHEAIADYLRSGNDRKTRNFDLDQLPARIALFAESHHIDFDISDWEDKAQTDLLALIQFVWDCNIEPIAVEIVGTWTDGKYRFAGAIDLICEMTIEEKGFFGEVYKSGDKKGMPKESKQERRITAIVDFKSGKSGFFDDHAIQLHMYKMMAEYSLGLKIDKVFNCAPRDWTGETPTYDLKDQTDSIHAQKIPHLLGQFMVEYKAPKDIRLISGIVNGNGDLSQNVRTVSAADYVLQFIKNLPEAEVVETIKKTANQAWNEPEPAGDNLSATEIVEKIPPETDDLEQVEIPLMNGEKHIVKKSKITFLSKDENNKIVESENPPLPKPDANKPFF